MSETDRFTQSQAGGAGSPTPRRRQRIHARERRVAAVLLSPFLGLLAVAGVVPSLYAIYQSLRARDGSGFVLTENFLTVWNDFRFQDTFINIGKLLAIWIPIMMIGTVGLALLVHASRGRFATSMRFVFYLPGALAGMANFMLWLFILDPTVSPVAFIFEGFGLETLNEVVQPRRVPIIITAMLFFQGAGTWLVIVYGGLNSIPDDVLEAALVDGANSWNVAWRIKLPIIRPWIGYMTLMNVAYGFQLFLEPQVLTQATKGAVTPQWTPNQLGFTYAFQILNTPAAAAMSVILLVITLGLGLVIVTKTGLFDEARK